MPTEAHGMTYMYDDSLHIYTTAQGPYTPAEAHGMTYL